MTLAQENPAEWEITQVSPKPKLMDDDVYYPLGVLIEYAEAGMDISELRVIPEDQMAPSAVQCTAARRRKRRRPGTFKGRRISRDCEKRRH